MLERPLIKRLLNVYALQILLIAIFFSKFAIADSQPLIIGVHPFKSATEVSDQFSPLARVIEQTLHRKVKIEISKTYDNHIELVAKKQFDIAYLGPVSYVKLVNKFGKVPLLARLEINGQPTFQGKIFTTNSSNIRTIQQLKDKRFAFGSKSSTMSYIVPKFVLKQNGISLEDLATYDFLGNHSNVALSVLTGAFDAGAVKEAVFNKYKSQGLTLITSTPPLSEHLFVARSDLAGSENASIKNTLLNIHLTPPGKNALLKIKKGLNRLVPVLDSDYDQLREILSDNEISEMK